MANKNLPAPKTRTDIQAEQGAVPVPAYLARLADNMQISASGLKQVIMKTVFPGEKTSAEDFALFLMVAAQRELNPLMGEIYALPKKTGGIQVIIGKNGWNTLVNRNSAVYNGRSFSYYYNTPGADGKPVLTKYPHPLEGYDLIMVECILWRKDRDNPEVAFAKMSEYFKQTAYDSPWKSQPTTMLEHKAWNKAAAAAFGFADAVDIDEARAYCDIRKSSIPLVAYQEAIENGIIEGEVTRAVLPAQATPTPPKPNGVSLSAQANGTSSPPPPPAKPAQERHVQASKKAFGYAKGLFKGASCNETWFEEFLAWKKINLPISPADCSALIDAWASKTKDGTANTPDFSDVFQFIGEKHPEALADDGPVEAPDSPQEATEAPDTAPAPPQGEIVNPGASQGLFDGPGTDPAFVEGEKPIPAEWPFGVNLPKNPTDAKRMLLDAQMLCIKSAVANGYDDEAPARALDAWSGTKMHTATLAQLKEVFDNLKTTTEVEKQ